MRRKLWLLLGVALSLLSRTAPGLAVPRLEQEEKTETPQELATLKRELEALKTAYEARFTELESRITALEKGTGAPPPTPAPPPAPATAEVPPGAAGAGGPSGALPVYGSAAAGSKIFNPDIAVIGNFLGAAGSNSVDPQPALEMHESEASFQAIVDPYARADFFLAFGQEGVELEEGYISFPAIPGGLLVKVG